MASIIRAKHLRKFARIPSLDFWGGPHLFYRVNSLGLHAFNLTTEHYETYHGHDQLHYDHAMSKTSRDTYLRHLANYTAIEEGENDTGEARIELWTAEHLHHDFFRELCRPPKLVVNGCDLGRVTWIAPGRHLIFSETLPGNTIYFIRPLHDRFAIYHDSCPGDFNPAKKTFHSGAEQQKFLPAGSCTRFFIVPDSKKNVSFELVSTTQSASNFTDPKVY